MDYRTITDTTSKQFNLQMDAYTDGYGFRRIENDYIVALGTYYTDKCGDRFKITLDNYKYFTVIIGDIKNDTDTDCYNMYTPIKEGYGNVIEFIVDTDKLNRKTIITGDVSCSGLNGEIKKIEKIS